MTTKEKFDSLNKKSVWTYTKQKANFNDIFNSARLFSEIPDVKNTNVQEYFKDHHIEYGITTKNHRVLVIAQMFGLITKSKYYSRGGSSYSSEDTTPVFDELKKCQVGSVHFNKILSEQLIKIKVKPIIETTKFHKDYEIYPFLFLFLVMWKLDKDHSVKMVSMNKLWTYVLTCKSMDEINNAVNWMADSNAVITPYVNKYKDSSRFMTLFFECTKMFSLNGDQLSLNHPIADNFYNEFILKQNITDIQSFLKNEDKYRKYLENVQDFSFDLTKNDSGIIKHSHTIKYQVCNKLNKQNKNMLNEFEIRIPKNDTEEIDTILDDILDAKDEKDVKESNAYDTQEEIDNSNNRQPDLKSGLESKHRYSTDPRLAKTALKNAGYVCELSGKVGKNHSTFNSANGNKYLEAHHLIPMKAQKDFISLNVNIDRLENIIALCPNCHKAVHYGTRAEKIKYLKPLFNNRIKKLKAVGIDIDFNVLIDDYYK